jgi:mono/diheme cytochrome c family protein
MALSAGTPASAEPKFLPGFSETYPEAAASALNGCLLCHTSPSPSDEDDGRNPYGDDWEERGDKNYLAIENLDSDRDGFSNRVEIESLSFPGDPSSTPLTVTTTTTLPGTPPDGQALYAASCAACHGTGGGNLLNTTLSESQFVNAVASGQGVSMPAFGASLSTADIAAIYSYVTGAPPPTTTTTAPGTPPQPIDAASLFNSTCSGCHGPDGGNLVPTPLTSDQLASVITNGRAAMPGYASSLSGEQIQALANYLINQSTAPAPTTTTTTAPGTQPRTGAAVWASDCASCHGPAGGNVAGTALSKSQLVSVISNGTGSMPGFQGRIPAEEIAAVADFLRATAGTTTTTAPGTEPDGVTLYMQNCAICHGPHGEGGSGGAIAGSGLSPSEIRLIITDGTGSMAGFGSKLGTADTTALVDHVAGIVRSESSESAGDGAEVDDAGALVGGSVPTSQATTVAGGAEGDVTVDAIATLPEVSLPEPERRDSAGSPWLPVLPLVAVVSWLAFDAVKSGQLPNFTRKGSARTS